MTVGGMHDECYAGGFAYMTVGVCMNECVCGRICMNVYVGMHA